MILPYISTSLSPLVDKLIYYGTGLVLVAIVYIYVYSAMSFLQKRKHQLFKENKPSSKNKIHLRLRRTSSKKSRHKV